VPDRELRRNPIPRIVGASQGREPKEDDMDDAKRVGREVETQAKRGIRELDGHDLGDDIGNARDEVKKDLGNLGDDLRREGREAEDELDKSYHDRETTPR
jgi:hypothetical protein